MDQSEESEESKDVVKALKNKLEELTARRDKVTMQDIEEMKNYLATVFKDVNNHNKIPLEQYNGFNRDQMTNMLYCELGALCPVQLRTLTDEEIQKIPFMRQTLHLMNSLSEKEIKLTPKGNLPVKMVEALYELGCHNWSSDLHYQKTEDRVPEVHLMRTVLKETGLIKVHTGKLSLSAKGKKLLNTNHNKLLGTIMKFLFTKFNTGWFDMRDDYDMGNRGRLYSLWLLHHYGSEWRDEEFYAKEYFKAFPSLWKETENKYFTYEHLYTLRVFDRFFYLIGLCERKETINKEEHTTIREVRKTDILDMMFSFVEPTKV